MPRRRNGIVVGKDFKPPDGSPYADWCYLVVDLSDQELISVRITKNHVDKTVLGDRVEFTQPRKPDKAVRWLRHV